jgi:radical SAM superfamily enzyme YgiQ (UPF0313 family)
MIDQIDSSTVGSGKSVIPDIRGTILMVQLPIPTPTPLRETGNQPVAAASLWSSISHLGSSTPAMITLSRDIIDYGGDEVIISKIVSMNVDVVAFTCYLWNVERSLFLAGELKKRINCIIIVGGPEVTEDNQWLRHDSRWDIAIAGEGEGPWMALLTGLPGWDHAFLCRDFNKHRRGELPDQLSGISPHHSWIPLTDRHDDIPFIETGRGCVSKCAFCTYGDHRYQKRNVSLPILQRELDAIHAMNGKEVFLLDPALNRRANIIDFLNVLRESRLYFSVELDGYSVDSRMAKHLAASGIREVEIGLQSCVSSVRKALGCPGGVQEILQGVRFLTDQGISVRLDLIFGLPGDTEHDVNQGIETVRQAVPDADIQLFPLLVLPGSRIRRDAMHLGLKFRDRPPYNVLETPFIREDQMLRAWDYSSTLAESHEDEPIPDMYMGSGVGSIITRIFVSFPSAVLADPEQLGKELGSQLGTGITVRVRRNSSRKTFTEWLHTFLLSLLRRNPYTCVTILFDGGSILDEHTERMLLNSIRQPWHYLEKRSLEYRDGTGRIFFVPDNPDSRPASADRHPGKQIHLLRLQAGEIFEIDDVHEAKYPIGRTAYIPTRRIWEDIE